MPKLKNFEIDPEYMCSVSDRTVYYTAKDPSNPTSVELLKIIKHGPISMTVQGSKDHPEFDKLRNLLERQGYIKTCRCSWNGDIALKSFKINNVTYKKGERFLSGSAFKYTYDRKRKALNVP
jgi:hypothetical protein